MPPLETFEDIGLKLSLDFVRYPESKTAQTFISQWYLSGTGQPKNALKYGNVGALLIRTQLRAPSWNPTE